MKQILLTLAMFCILASVMAQKTNTFPKTGSAGIGTVKPDTSALLEMVSTSKGLLIPRMKQAQKDAIYKPATGLMVFQTNAVKGFYYYNGTMWTALNPVNGLNDNVFIGQKAGFLTTTATGNIAIGKGSLQNNIDVGDLIAIGDSALFNNGIGKTSYTQALHNTAIGKKSLFFNTIGSQNTAIGHSSLFYNTSGAANSALGYGALYSNTSGAANTSIGNASLSLNTTGDFNTASGNYSLGSNTTGNDNSAYGAFSLESNTTGLENVAVGSNAMERNLSGSQNTAIGKDALYSNTDGGANTAIGYQSLYSSTATGNTATGYKSLFANTTGGSNTAFGSSALQYNTTGGANTAIGNFALFNTTTALGNVGIGYSALISSSGNYSTGAGYLAGSANKGSYNTYLGYNANFYASQLVFDNSTAIGANSRVTGGSQVRIGSSSIVSIGGYVNWSNISDGRFKKNVKENVIGLAFINKLRPVTYNLDIISINKKTGIKEEAASKSITEKGKIIYSGFIAQEVEKAAKDLGYNFSGVDAPKNDNDLYGLRYAEFVVPLVKAVQELSKIIDDKDAKLNDQQKQIDELRKIILTVQQNLNSCNPCNNTLSQSTQSFKLFDGAMLEQNIPNPFTGSTTIGYSLPEKYSSAYIMIINKNGKLIKQVLLNGTGKQTININIPEVASGAYQYSLYINNNLIETKQMAKAK